MKKVIHWPDKNLEEFLLILFLFISLFLLIVGMVMDTTHATLILSPLLLPIITKIGMVNQSFESKSTPASNLHTKNPLQYLGEAV